MRSRWITVMGLACIGLALLLTQGSHGADPAAQHALLKQFREEFVEITPGKGDFPSTFEMGSTTGTSAEAPVHQVTLQHAFSMNRYEVPQNLYELVQGENPSRWKGPRNSAEMFTATQARDFCKKVTSLLREARLITQQEEIRLPTEAEWEYCCRAGTKTAFSFGESATKPGEIDKKASLLDPYGWHTGNAAGNDPPVGALKPNPWGLYDMHGYLWEITTDDWHDQYHGAPNDGSAWLTPAKEGTPPPGVVLRGGSWKEHHSQLRSSSRKRLPAGETGDDIGFRCVLAPIRN